jgi:hypothetical protein
MLASSSSKKGGEKHKVEQLINICIWLRSHRRTLLQASTCKMPRWRIVYPVPRNTRKRPGNVLSHSSTKPPCKIESFTHTTKIFSHLLPLLFPFTHRQFEESEKKRCIRQGWFIGCETGFQSVIPEIYSHAFVPYFANQLCKLSLV